MTRRTLPYAALVVLVVLALFVGFAGSPRAQERAGGQATFDKLKALTGEWQAPLPKNEVMINIFRPIAFGSAILHEEWKNGEQLTATVFYLVGTELRADHFCDYKNQPRYVVKPAADGALAFEMRDATNLDVHPRHFHATTWRLVDATHHTQEWHVAEPGKETKIVRLAFTRTK